MTSKVKTENNTSYVYYQILYPFDIISDIDKEWEILWFSGTLRKQGNL
jgi:hypothetical protein